MKILDLNLVRKNAQLGKYNIYIIGFLFTGFIFITMINLDIFYKTSCGLPAAAKCWETPVKTILSEEHYEKFKQITRTDSLQMRNSSKTYAIDQCSFEFYIRGNHSIIQDCFKYAAVSNTTIQLLHNNNGTDVVRALAKQFEANKDLATLNHLYVKGCVERSLKGPLYNMIETYLFRSIRFCMEIGFQDNAIFKYCYIPLELIFSTAILVFICKKSKKIKKI